MIGWVALLLGVGQDAVFQDIELLADKDVVNTIIHRCIELETIERAFWPIGRHFRYVMRVAQQRLDGLDLLRFGC